MFTLSFLYPRPIKRSFDYEYHRSVHLPLGIGWTARSLGLKPTKVWIERITQDDPSSTEPYAAIAHVMFQTEHERNSFATLFENKEVARRLSVDWSFFTEAPPQVRIGTWTFDDDMSGLIEHFEANLVNLHAAD